MFQWRIKQHCPSTHFVELWMVTLQDLDGARLVVGLLLRQLNLRKSASAEMLRDNIIVRELARGNQLAQLLGHRGSTLTPKRVLSAPFARPEPVHNARNLFSAFWHHLNHPSRLWCRARGRNDGSLMGSPGRHVDGVGLSERSVIHE